MTELIAAETAALEAEQTATRKDEEAFEEWRKNTNDSAALEKLQSTRKALIAARDEWVARREALNGWRRACPRCYPKGG